MYGQVLFLCHEATGDLDALTDSLRLLTSCLAGLPPGSGQRPRILRSLALAHTARATQISDDAELRTATDFALQALGECRPGSPDAHIVVPTAVAVLTIAGVALEDPALVRIAVERMDSIVNSLVGRPNYERLIGGFGIASVFLANNGGTEDDRRRGIRFLQEAYDILLPRTGATTLPSTAMALAEAYAAQGDLDRAIQVGRTALVGRAWLTLLQTGTHNAMSAVRQGAENALTIARWCLRDGRTNEAYEALETGRGLVLHAATVTATFADLLRAAGRGDLADEWVAVAPDGVTDDARDWRIGVPGVPSDLRHRALTALAGHPLLFEPPPVAAAAAALATLRCDALVYLFPGVGSDAGLALIVDVDSDVMALDLPELTAERARTLAAGHPATREILVPAPADRPLDLDSVVEAAWSAAIGPLLAHWHRTYADHPRFVLVPAGTLAAIPWHAAYEPKERRWAIDEADFSSIASGRLLIEVAARPNVAPSGSALIIGNPDTGEAGDDLPGAGEEASTIHRRFFPAGTYRGRPCPPSTGPGVAADVFDWLTGRDVPHAPVLHLACHATVRAEGPATSSLRLSDGELSAEEILRTAALRPPGTSLGLVSLAACTTHLAGRDYDEAVTLSTAFVVAGATTAIGSLWRVPDRETALLMVAFYENLLVHAMPPGDALRYAQRWLRDLPGTPLSGWAGFVHIGV